MKYSINAQYTRQYLSAGNIHSGGVEAVFDLRRVVHLQNIASTILDIVGQLTVFKEVHHERHLPDRSTSMSNITVCIAYSEIKRRKNVK